MFFKALKRLSYEQEEINEMLNEELVRLGEEEILEKTLIPQKRTETEGG